MKIDTLGEKLKDPMKLNKPSNPSIVDNDMKLHAIDKVLSTSDNRNYRPNLMDFSK